MANERKKEWFDPWIALVFICCFALQIVFIAEFGGVKVSEYSAFLQNLLMSVLFLSMYIRRGSMEGQSILLAVAKWLGPHDPDGRRPADSCLRKLLFSIRSALYLVAAKAQESSHKHKITWMYLLFSIERQLNSTNE